MNDDQQRFHALCFLHACGKTDAEEAAWMERAAAADPDLRAALDAERALVSEARAGLAAERAAARPLLDFEQVAPAVQAPGLAERLHRWLRGALSLGWQAGALATLLLAVLAQTYRLQQAEAELAEPQRYRSLALPARSAQLRVVFSDDARAGVLTATLSRLGLEIVQGPDRQGVYRLVASHGDAAAAAEQLRQSGLVLDVQAVPTP